MIDRRWWNAPDMPLWWFYTSAITTGLIVGAILELLGAW
jgi:hypothetical protein